MFLIKSAESHAKRLEPYYALAEELDVPVGIHTGLGPPGTPYLPGLQGFRVTLGNQSG